MLRMQREAARVENGVYTPGDIPRITLDEVTALAMYFERAYSSADNWSTATADHLLVGLSLPGPDGRPTRPMGDVLDIDEAGRTWRVFEIRAANLDPMCSVVGVPGPGFPTPPTITLKKTGHCPRAFKYVVGTQAQLLRAERIGLAIQRVNKVIKPPPLLDPIGSLLRGFGWLILLALVVSTAENPHRRR